MPRCTFRRVVSLSFELQKQTFLEIPGCNTRGIKSLDFSEYFFYFINISFNIHAKRQVVYNCLKITPYVAVVFDAANQLLTNFFCRSSSLRKPS
jgi:dTDP-4-dehydrorhamnose 3,5-epimerase-like enzyme